MRGEAALQPAVHATNGAADVPDDGGRTTALAASVSLPFVSTSRPRLDAGGRDGADDPYARPDPTIHERRHAGQFRR